MVNRTPFHERLERAQHHRPLRPLVRLPLGPEYDTSAKHEYFAVRNTAGFFDTSPLYKYRIAGPDAERFLAGVMTRDIRQCRPGRAQYTVWCDDRGLRARGRRASSGTPRPSSCSPRPSPTSATSRDLVGAARRRRSRTSPRTYGMLAVQGPRSREILRRARPGGRRSCAYFEHRRRQDRAGAPVTISRTGYTGDLGYEIRVPARRRPGRPRRASSRPASLRAPALRRGGPADDPDRGGTGAHQRRVLAPPGYAYTDHDRVTPKELGLGWMLRGSTPRTARSSAATPSAASWPTRPPAGPRVGLVLDWADYDRVYTRGRTHPAQGRDAAGLRVDAVRRRGRAGRLRDQPDVLADAPAAHRDGPGPARTSPPSARASTSSSPSTTSTRRWRPR